MLVEHIKALKNNVPIEHPVYSFVDHDRTSESIDASSTMKTAPRSGLRFSENFDS